MLSPQGEEGHGGHMPAHPSTYSSSQTVTSNKTASHSSAQGWGLTQPKDVSSPLSVLPTVLPTILPICGTTSDQKRVLLTAQELLLLVLFLFLLTTRVGKFLAEKMEPLDNGAADN